MVMNDIESIYKRIEKIEYGWFDKNGKKHSKISEGLAKNYNFQSPKELEKSKIGICWEVVELTKVYLEEKNIPYKSYFFVLPFDNFYCHSVLVCNIDDKYYWIEGSLKDYKGIHEFNSIEELVFYVLDHFYIITNNEEYDVSKIKIYEYDKPKYGIGCVQFYFHCFRSKNITKKYMNKYLKIIEDKR